MRLISFDPGGTTGIGLYDTESQVWDHDQIGPEEHHAHLWDILQTWDFDVIICERFNYQRRELDKGVALELVSREYIGIIRLYCELNDIPLVMQNPMKTTNAASFWTDSKLKTLGLYSTNAPHANDATGHLMYYLMTELKDQSYVIRLRPALAEQQSPPVED